MTTYQFIIEILRSATILILIFTVIVSNKTVRKLSDKYSKSEEEIKNLKEQLKKLQTVYDEDERIIESLSGSSYEEIKNDKNLSDEEKKAALHKMYMDKMAEENR